MPWDNKTLATLKAVGGGAGGSGTGGGEYFENGIIKQSALPEGYGYDSRVGVAWDGNTEGLTEITSGWNYHLYGPFENKWGLTVQDFIGVTVENPIGASNNTKITITEEHISADGKSIYVRDRGYGIFCFVEEGATMTPEYGGDPFTPGIWLCKYLSNNNQLIVSGEISAFDEVYTGKQIKVLEAFPDDPSEMTTGLYWFNQGDLFADTMIYGGLYSIVSGNGYIEITSPTTNFRAGFYQNDEGIWVIDFMTDHVAESVPDAAGETVTAAEFNALLASLRNAGLMWNS